MEKEKKDLRVGYSDREEWKEVIYDLMNGIYDLEQYPMKESTLIQDEFAEGKPCERAYDAVYKAKKRLCSKLGKTEDPDVELIIANLQEIGRHLSMKMYDYGEIFGDKQ